MSNNLIIFVGKFDFNKDSSTVYGFNLLELTKRDNQTTGRSQTLFSREPIDVSNIQAGDIVECGFDVPQFLNAKPKLVSIKKVKSYSDYLPF